MNDFEMMTLANERIDGYRAEADSVRLARTTHKVSSRKPGARAHMRRLGLGSMFSRVAFF